MKWNIPLIFTMLYLNKDNILGVEEDIGQCNGGYRSGFSLVWRGEFEEGGRLQSAHGTKNLSSGRGIWCTIIEQWKPPTPHSSQHMTWCWSLPPFPMKPRPLPLPLHLELLRPRRRSSLLKSPATREDGEREQSIHSSNSFRAFIFFPPCVAALVLKIGESIRAKINYSNCI